MNVSLFSAHWSTLGGGEQYLATLADSLTCMGHRVFVHGVEVDTLRKRFGLPLEGVWRGSLAADLSIITSNVRSYGYPGKKTVYIIQIPYSDLGWGLKDLSRRWLLYTAKEAEDVWVYSRFVAEELSDHGIRAHVLYPTFKPVKPARKRQLILSVGRIFRDGYNQKHYRDLIQGFRHVYRHYPDAEYVIAGGCNDFQYLEELKLYASDVPVTIYANPAREFLDNLYGEALIFWHGAGYGETRPENMEHFGISTLEAMSAGCVPIVFNGGGQREIVQPGQGLLWNTLDELSRLTCDVLRVPASSQGMALRATYRAMQFGRVAFDMQLNSRLMNLGF